MINRPAFYNRTKTNQLFASIKPSQIDGIEAILNEWESNPILTDLRWLSYMLATTYHETAKTMQPIEEYGKGHGHPYGSKIKRSGEHYLTPDKIFYGRGNVQLTWYENYESFGKLLKIDLLNNPELALTMSISIKIMFLGMTKGLFTGVRLSRYFNSETEDYVNARKIINRLDKADLIAGYAKKFYECLNSTLIPTPALNL